MSLNSIESLRNLYDLVSVPAMLKDRHHTIVYANAAYAEFLGRDKEALVGTDGVGVYGVSTVEEFKAHDLRVLETGDEYRREFDVRAKNGAIRRVRITKKRVELNGEPYVFGTIDDLRFA